MVARNAERADRKREQIRDGAWETFLAQGFTGASTSQVAAAAGVSKQTLYSYYRSKEDLLVDVFSHVLDGLVASPEVWERPVDTREDLRDVLRTIALGIPRIAMNENYLSLVRVIIGELPKTPALGELWRSSAPAVGMQRVQGVLRRAHDAGVLRDVDLDLANRLFFGPLLSFILLDGLVRPGNVVQPDPARLEELVDLYLRAVT